MAPQREWFEKDYYKVLGVDASADQKAITKAYRSLARETHPDSNPGKEERFKEISAAYDVVGDPDRRKEYDEVRRLGPAANPFGGGGGGGGGGPFGGGGGFRVEDLGDLGDVLGGIFGRRGGRGGAPRPPGPQRGGDLETELHLSFVDAVHGVTTTVNLTSEAACSTCHGSGAEPGSAPVSCPTCGGRGVTDDNQGLFSLSAPCTRCAGRGTIVEQPCHTCGGTGSERRPRSVKVRIAAGVEHGARIRVKGRGTPGRNGGPAGDLFVIVFVAGHPLFGRRGNDLTLAVPITFPEAALGAEITVPTLDGPTVTLRVPAGTRSGRTFRVKGRGVPASAGVGDLMVTVEVAVPGELGADERQAVEALAAASASGPSIRSHLGAGQAV